MRARARARACTLADGDYSSLKNSRESVTWLSILYFFVMIDDWSSEKKIAETIKSG